MILRGAVVCSAESAGVYFGRVTAHGCCLGQYPALKFGFKAQVMRRFVLAVATIGPSLVFAASLANAAGKGSGAPQGTVHGNANSTAGAPASSAGQSGGASSNSVLTQPLTIQPSGGDDQLNLRRTILRLPF
jgi:hypothetical protein